MLKDDFAIQGFRIVPGILEDIEIKSILEIVSKVDTANANFRKSKDLFAVRQFLKLVPEVAAIISGSRLMTIISEGFGKEYFIVKSIYFDKPPASNWFVSYHQDLTISVCQRLDVKGFGPWTVKDQQFAVQPPLAILEDNITVRIHLDDTTKENGALKVIPGSQLKGICRPESVNRDSGKEITCEVPAGGAMFMKPLLLHSSGRTTNQLQRRVIHIEFSRSVLPAGLEWSELSST